MFRSLTRLFLLIRGEPQSVLGVLVVISSAVEAEFSRSDSRENAGNRNQVFRLRLSYIGLRWMASTLLQNQ